jgi:hypothetical protein
VSPPFPPSHEDLLPRPSGARPTVTVSARLALSVRALGTAGKAWLARLPDLLAGLEVDWSVTVGAGLDGGGACYVAEAVTRDGAPVILKVSIPPGIEGFTPFDRQLAALRPAGGDPYVGLIRHDVPSGDHTAPDVPDGRGRHRRVAGAVPGPRRRRTGRR